jgi:hypothetical protein
VILNSNLLDILKVLNSKELKAFSRFLQSFWLAKGPYKQETVTLFELLLEFAPDFEVSEEESEKIKAIVMGEEALVQNKFDRVMVELVKLLKYYVLIDQYLDEENDLELQADYIEFLLKRKLQKRAAGAAKILSEDLEKIKNKNTKNYFLGIRISLLIKQIETHNNTWRNDMGITNALEFLDAYFFNTKLSLLNHYNLLNLVGKIDDGIDLEKEKTILKLLEKNTNSDVYALISKKIFDLFTGDITVEKFEELNQLITDNQRNLEEKFIAEFYIYLSTYCSILINSGHNYLWPVQFDLLKKSLESGFLYNENNISSGGFMTILIAGLRVKNLEWTKEFIENHKERISGDNKTVDYYKLGLAQYYFEIKDYDKAIEFTPAASNNLMYHLIARRLELRVYFETNSDLLSFKIDAFKMYLSRNKGKILSNENYEMNNNFVNLLQQISQSGKGDKKRHEVLVKRIEEKKNLFLREWLMEKANDIIQKGRPDYR